MKKLILLPLLLALLFARCTNESLCPKIENMLAGSLVSSERYVNFVLYQDGELSEQTWGILHMKKTDETHISFELRPNNSLDSEIFIDNILVSGELFNVELSYESDLKRDYFMIDSSKYYLSYVSLEGWMKDTYRYTETRDCGYGAYNLWDIELSFTLEDGRDFIYKLSRTE